MFPMLGLESFLILVHPLAVEFLLALAPLVLGLVTVTELRRSNDQVVLGVIATLDADTDTGNIAHGLGVVPNPPIITPTLQAEALLSGWAITTRDATNIVATKSIAVGSGDAARQIEITITRPR